MMGGVNYTSGMVITLVGRKKKVLSRTLKGSSAVPIGVPFLVPCRTFLQMVLHGTKKGAT